MNVGVNSRIPADAKGKTSKELTVHGLSISNFIHMTLSFVTNDGPPKYWGIPNTETMSSINETADDLSKHRLKGASSYSELEKLLGEQSYPNRPF